VLPETDSAEVKAVFDYVLTEYNATAVEQVTKIPTVAVLYILKDVAGEAWDNLVQQVENGILEN